MRIRELFITLPIIVIATTIVLLFLSFGISIITYVLIILAFLGVSGFFFRKRIILFLWSYSIPFFLIGIFIHRIMSALSLGGILVSVVFLGMMLFVPALVSAAVFLLISMASGMFKKK